MTSPDLFQKAEAESPVLVHALSRILSKREAAAFFDVTTTTIDRWIDAGMPIASRGPSGAITGLDLCAVARWRIERAGDGSELDRERTRLTKAQADKAELEAALLRSDTVRTPLIEQHWQAMVAAMRAELLALPSRAAPRVLGMTDHNDLVDTLRDEVHSALAHIAGDAFPEEVRRRIDELNKENNE